MTRTSEQDRAAQPGTPVFDAVIVADPWLLAQEGETPEPLLEAMIARGWRVGLVAIRSELSGRTALAPGIAAMLAKGDLRLITGTHALPVGVVLIYHLAPLLAWPDRQPRLQASDTILRVDRSWDGVAHHHIAPWPVISERAFALGGTQPRVMRAHDGIALPSGVEADTLCHLTGDQTPPVGATPAPTAWLALLGELSARPEWPRRGMLPLSQAQHRVRQRVVMLSPNGIGMGHLTRQLAIARHLPPEIEPVFLSMSQACAVAGDFGFHHEYLPGPHARGVDAQRWTADFTERLIDAVTFYDARAVVFDGNYPYHALVQARARLPDRRFVWLRRGLWRATVGPEALRHADRFDLIIEPGDYAATQDRGPTAGRSDAQLVPPITLLDEVDILPRAAARAALELPADAFAVLIQLGAGTNFAMDGVLRVALDWCAARPDTHARVVRWLIANEEEDPCAAYDQRIRRLRGFPLIQFVHAFDAVVSATGYNSFHELLSLGVPSVFVPNENPIMDEQEARAGYAERMGLARSVSARAPERLAEALDALRDPLERDVLQRRLTCLPRANGARAAARMIAWHTLAYQLLRD